jgi:protocatechuate 3,4-dioxygenase beta subunit
MKRALLGGCLFILAGMMIVNAAVISGTVSDSANSPLKNIKVSLRNTTTAVGGTITSDTTDSLGAYSMTCSDTLTGKYTVRTLDNAVPAVYFGQYDTVTLDGTAKTVNVKMSLVAKVTLSGTVTDSASGTALKGVIIKIQALTGTTTRTDTTDSLGKYSFDTVGSSTYTISTTVAGYNAASISKVVTTTATVDIKLSPIQYGTVSGKVSDSATGTAVKGASVGVYNAMGYLKIDSAVTDTNGQFTIDSIPVGKIKISFSATGYNARTDSIASLTTAKPETLNVTLAKTVYLSVAGKVSDSASGTAVAGAIVSIMVGTTYPFVTKTDTSNTDGTYSLDSISATTKKIIVTVSATGYTTKRDSVSTDTAKSYTLNLTPAKMVYFSVTGKVSDSATGAAIGGAIVILRQSPYAVKATDSVTTDTNGYYTVDSAFVGASFTLTITTTGSTTPKLVQVTGWTTSATDTVNVLIFRKVGVLRNSHFVRANQTISVAADRLILKNVIEPGILRLFNAKGEMIFNREFRTGEAILMNFTNRIPSGAYVLKIHQKSGALSKLITIR